MMTDESQKAELKKQLISAYFAAWRQDLGKAKELLGKPEYDLTAILVLSCYIAALARLRYPDTDSEREVYTAMLREHYGQRGTAHKGKPENPLRAEALRNA